MAKVKKGTEAASEREVVITRVFNAPRELVWKCFMDPEQIGKWWGPAGLTTRMEAHDPRPGGRWRYVMVAADGKEYPAEGTFREIVPMERFVTSNEFGADYVHPVPSDLPSGMASSTFLFADDPGGTRLTMRIEQATVEDRMKLENLGAVAGWQSSFDCLDEHLRTLAALSEADREIAVSRLLDAPRELVFDAFTDVKHVSKWWGPVGFTTTTHEHALRAGGVWRFTMHGPDGVDYGNKIVYDEIARPSLLRYHHAGEGATADIAFRVTVTFEERGGKTLVTNRAIFETRELRDQVERDHGAVEGGRQMLARLAEQVAKSAGKPVLNLIVTLPSDREIRMARTFDAPRALVYDALTKPEILLRWNYGPDEWRLAVCEVDLRVGGSFRYVWRNSAGVDMGLNGSFRELETPNLIVHTETFDEDWTGGETVITTTLDERDSTTTLTMTILYSSTEARDAALKTPMDEGVAAGYERLVGVLASMV